MRTHWQRRRVVTVEKSLIMTLMGKVIPLRRYRRARAQQIALRREAEINTSAKIVVAAFAATAVLMALLQIAI